MILYNYAIYCQECFLHFLTILTVGLLKLCKEERTCLVEGEGTSKKTNRRKPGLNTGTKKTTAANRMSRTPNRTKITRSQSGKRLNSMWS